jgi:plasmid stabilization system protein ParE
VTYSLHPGAEQDIVDALDFYTERAGLLVAQRFLDEFERVAKLLVTHPGFGTPTSKGRRVFPLRVFPSCIGALRQVFESLWFVTSTENQATAAHGGSCMVCSSPRGAQTLSSGPAYGRPLKLNG